MFVTAVQLIVARTLVQARKDLLLKQFDSPMKRANAKASRMPPSAFSSHTSEFLQMTKKKFPNEPLKRTEPN